MKFRYRPSKIKELFLSPKTFFKRIDKEKEYLPILLFFVITFTILNFVKWIASIPYSLTLPTGGGISIIFGFLGLLFGIGWAFIMPFISAGVCHLGVLIVGGKKGFFNTFKPIAYSSIIAIIYSVASNILIAFLLIAFPMGHMTQEAEIISSPGFMIIIMTAVIFTVIGGIHSIYAVVQGLSRFHRLSKGKAFVAAFIIPFALMMIVAIFLGIILFLIAALAKTAG